MRQFDTNTVGPQNILEDHEPYVIFSMYFDNDILSVLVTKTNLYYEQYIQLVGGVDNLPTHSRARKWRPVSVAEMKSADTHALKDTIPFRITKLSVTRDFMIKLKV